jgi:hydroxymethylbilane synthase
MVRSINDGRTLAAVSAERALVAALGGGCQTPIGALAIPEGDALRMHAAVASLDGRRLVRAEADGRIDRPDELGVELARLLDAQGAGEILREASHEA